MISLTSPVRWRLSNSQPVRNVRWYILICVALQTVPLILDSYDPYSFPFAQTYLATQLAIACAFPTIHYFAGSGTYPPIFPLICLSYGYQFAIPIFTRYPLMETIDGTVSLTDESVIAALWLAILGAVAFMAGYFVLTRRTIRTGFPVLKVHLNRKKAIVHCVVVLFLYLLSFPLLAAQSSLQSIANLLANQLLVAIGIMSWVVYSGDKAQLGPRALLWLLVLFQLYIGLASTTLETPLVGLCIVMIFKWTYTKRMPLKILAGVMGLMFFLQPVKVGVREDTWYGSSSGAQAVVVWLDQAFLYWWDAVTSDRPLAESTSSTFGRSDFIHQFAHIYSLTPSAIPYQYGGTYSFFIVSFVPRIIWPDKPVISTNTFYGITYGITTKEGAERSNFGVSLVGESFINFGLLGVILIMGLQGAGFGLLENVFAGPKSGAGAQAVFLSCSIWFLNGVGSSAEVLFGGIVQNLLAGSALLLWARLSHPPEAAGPSHGGIQTKLRSPNPRN